MSQCSNACADVHPEPADWREYAAWAAALDAAVDLAGPPHEAEDCPVCEPPGAADGQQFADLPF